MPRQLITVVQAFFVIDYVMAQTQKKMSCTVINHDFSGFNEILPTAPKIICCIWKKQRYGDI